MGGHQLTLGVKPPRSQDSQVGIIGLYIATMLSWTNFFISLHLSFLICKKGENNSVYLIGVNKLIYIKYLQDSLVHVSSLKIFTIIISNFPLRTDYRFVIIVPPKLFQNLILFGLHKLFSVYYFYLLKNAFLCIKRYHL